MKVKLMARSGHIQEVEAHTDGEVAKWGIRKYLNYHGPGFLVQGCQDMRFVKKEITLNGLAEEIYSEE